MSKVIQNLILDNLYLRGTIANGDILTYQNGKVTWTNPSSLITSFGTTKGLVANDILLNPGSYYYPSIALKNRFNGFYLDLNGNLGFCRNNLPTLYIDSTKTRINNSLSTNRIEISDVAYVDPTNLGILLGMYLFNLTTPTQDFLTILNFDSFTNVTPQQSIGGRTNVASTSPISGGVMTITSAEKIISFASRTLFSFSVWFYLTSDVGNSGSVNLINFKNTAQTNVLSFSLRTTDNRIIFNFNTIGNPAISNINVTGFTLNSWHHLGFSSGSGGIKIWVNNVSVYTNPSTLSITNLFFSSPINSINVGSNSYGGHFDDLIFIGSELDNTKINNLFTGAYNLTGDHNHTVKSILRYDSTSSETKLQNASAADIIGITNSLIDIRYPLRYTGSTPSAGRVLTSDGSGNATWQSLAPASSTIYTGDGSIPLNVSRTIILNNGSSINIISQNILQPADFILQVGGINMSSQFGFEISSFGAIVISCDNVGPFYLKIPGFATGKFLKCIDGLLGESIFANITIDDVALTLTQNKTLTGAGFNFGFTGVNAFSTSSATATFQTTGNLRLLPAGSTGTAGQVLTTNGAGVVSWQSLAPAASTIYNSDGKIPAGVEREVALANGSSLLFRQENAFDSTFLYLYAQDITITSDVSLGLNTSGSIDIECNIATGTFNLRIPGYSAGKFFKCIDNVTGESIFANITIDDVTLTLTQNKTLTGAGFDFGFTGVNAYSVSSTTATFQTTGNLRLLPAGSTGTAGQVLTTNGAGVVSWQSLSPAASTIYNSDGSIAAGVNRVITLNNASTINIISQNILEPSDFILQIGGILLSAQFGFEMNSFGPIVISCDNVGPFYLKIPGYASDKFLKCIDDISGESIYANITIDDVDLTLTQNKILAGAGFNFTMNGINTLTMTSTSTIITANSVRLNIPTTPSNTIPQYLQSSDAQGTLAFGSVLLNAVDGNLLAPYTILGNGFNILISGFNSLIMGGSTISLLASSSFSLDLPTKIVGGVLTCTNASTGAANYQLPTKVLAGFEIVNNTTATTIAVAGTYVKATVTGSNLFLANSSFWTRDSPTVENRVKYVGTAPNGRLVQISGGVLLKSSAANQIVSARIAKNGTLVSGAGMETTITTSGDVTSMTVHGLTSIATNDFFEIFVTTKSGTNSVTVTQSNLQFSLQYQ